jgi:hypothetical protein
MEALVFWMPTGAAIVAMVAYAYMLVSGIWWGR